MPERNCKKLLIIGAGGHGKVIADAALSMRVWEEIAFIDENKSLGSRINGIEIVGKLRDLDIIFPSGQYDVVVGVGANNIRKDIIKHCVSLNFNLPVIIHSTAYVSLSAKVDIGTVIFANAVINPDCVIGKGCIVNTSASIDHDSILEDFVHISPGAHLAGGTHVKENSWVGIGACTKQQICIGVNAIVGAGAVVVNHVDDGCVVAGNPARILVK